MKKKEEISNVDKQAWEKYIENPKDIFDKDRKSSNKNYKNSRYKFDLHGFSLVDANKKVKEIITECYYKKCSEVLLITGKGIHSNTHSNSYVSDKLSKLRYSIPDFINSDKDLLNKTVSIKKAEVEDGGDGALVIKIRKL
ncbi:Smr/MutS family protein [Pelagibacteraceae bacterium]|nr:Smr/MutS family protein [Pelagibacteraceae bacterium]